ncbi:MAG: ribonuclease III [Eubacterium sp.]|nr:ribonuclease III [Eubacterium sp.]
MFETIKEQLELEDIDVADYSPLTLAYIGDAVFEVVVRTVIVDEANRSVSKIHKAASDIVNAKSQAKMMFNIMDSLTDEESKVYKRGRNAKAVTKAKNASMADYRVATGFEALIGWLYLNNKTKRMLELIKLGLDSR